METKYLELIENEFLDNLSDSNKDVLLNVYSKVNLHHLENDVNLLLLLVSIRRILLQILPNEKQIDKFKDYRVSFVRRFINNYLDVDSIVKEFNEFVNKRPFKFFSFKSIFIDTDDFVNIIDLEAELIKMFCDEFVDCFYKIIEDNKSYGKTLSNLSVLEITDSVLLQEDAGLGCEINLVLVPTYLKDKWFNSDLKTSLAPVLSRNKGKIVYYEY